MNRKILNLFFILVLVVSLGLMTALPALPAQADTTYYLEVVSYGRGSVTSPGEGTFPYPAGISVTLVAVAESGYAFLSWIGDVDNVSDIYASTTTITMTGDLSIYAYFSGSGTTTPSTTSYTITATAGANGSISPAGAVTVSSDGSQTFTITAYTGYRISNVLVDGASVGAVASYTFYNVIANHTIDASFTLNTFNITATAGANGSISPAGAVSVNYGSSQTFIFAPSTGYHIVSVLVDGASVGTVASYAFTNVTTTHTISVTFAINTYTLTATAAANGAISPPGASTVNYGSSQTYNITPSTGYHIASVLVDGASVGTAASYTFTNVTTDHAIAVTFAINTYTITPTIGDHGTTSPFTAVTVNYGSSQNFTIAPNIGYHIASVLVDGAPIGIVPSYTFTNVIANHTIAVTFAINTYAITPTAGTHGTISPFTAVTVNYGSSQNFTIAADTAYRIADVLVDGVSVGAVDKYTFTNVTAVHTIAVSFTYGWPIYTAAGVGVLLVFLLGFWAGRSRSSGY